VAGDDGERCQGLDHIQRGGHFLEGLQALDFGKHHAEAVFPERIGRDQCAAGRLEQDDGVRVMPRRGMDLPVAPGQPHAGAGLQYAGQRKWRAFLAGGGVAQRLGIPVAHEFGLARRDIGPGLRPARLQCGIAAAVVAVQMGVEDARQRLASQRLLDQQHGLPGMADVAGIDHGRAVVLRIGRVGREDDVVGRQPAALQHGHAAGQRSGGACGGEGGHGGRSLSQG
jgi:hypothetical protein